jgi:hypothetical protein
MHSRFTLGSLVARTSCVKQRASIQVSHFCSARNNSQELGQRIPCLVNKDSVLPAATRGEMGHFETENTAAHIRVFILISFRPHSYDSLFIFIAFTSPTQRIKQSILFGFSIPHHPSSLLYLLSTKFAFTKFTWPGERKASRYHNESQRWKDSPSSEISTRSRIST